MAFPVSMVAVFVLCLSLIIEFSSAAPVEKEVIGLYGTEDNVTILTGSYFNETVFNSPYIWLVEFYSSWCGHCQEFAPTFKSFAKDVAEWQGVYRLAVINCPDKLNRHTCIGMDIKGYPELRIFHPFSSRTEPGEKVQGRTVEQLRNVSIHHVEKHLSEVKWDLPGILKPSFDFISYEDVLSFLKNQGSRKFQENQENPYYLALVVETRSSNMGKEIILDISSCRNISTRRFNSESAEIMKLAAYTGMSFENLPSVIVLMKNGRTQEVKVEIQARSFYSYKLRNLPGVGDPKPLPKQVLKAEADSGITYIDWTQVDRSKVYLADIESGLRYALTVEIGSVKILEYDSLDAVRNFAGTIALLSDHFPASASTRKFLVRITAWLASKENIDYETWQQRLEVIEEGSYLPQSDQRWVGCAPSKQGLRGYPCSLWTLFHALTVAAYNADETDVEAVPRAMEGYITNFFSCMECRTNFIQELIEYPYEDKLKSNKDTILWLWELHNKVNKRLHGAVSEDPNMPKVQFPTADLCPKCHNKDGSWNKENVFMYLINRYSAIKVVKKFWNPRNPYISNKKSDHVGNILKDARHDKDFLDMDSAVDVEIRAKLEDHDFDVGEGNYDVPINAPVGKGHPQLIKELLKDRTKDQSVHLLEEFEGEVFFPNSDFGGWHNGSAQGGFTNLDTSLCIILWGISMLVVITIYFYMKRKPAIKRCQA